MLLKLDNFVRRHSKTFSGVNVEVICEQLLRWSGISEKRVLQVIIISEI